MILIIALFLLLSGPAEANMVEASFYGAGEKLNERTASGERFNPRSQTCAHPKFPFGTILKVTNPENGIWYECRVNDRGPAEWTGHDIDLTPRGFNLLRIPLRQGVADVKVERKK